MKSRSQISKPQKYFAFFGVEKKIRSKGNKEKDNCYSHNIHSKRFTLKIDFLDQFSGSLQRVALEKKHKTHKKRANSVLILVSIH